MFDIREYYNGSWKNGLDGDFIGVEDEIAYDIESLLINRVGNLYLCDRFKNQEHQIEIIYPETGYPGSQALIMTPDRIRFLLSFYPYRGDFAKVDKIVIRPRYFEAGNVELAAIYIKKMKVLVTYLTHLRTLSESVEDGAGFVSMPLENLMDNRIIENSIGRSGTNGGIPLLWYVLSVIDPAGSGDMDKFFLKLDRVNSKDHNLLNDISHFYSRHGY